MTLSNLLVFALALMVAAGSPGPSVAALVARVLTNGFRDVLPFLAAMWLGEALWLGCAVAGTHARAGRRVAEGPIVVANVRHRTHDHARKSKGHGVLPGALADHR